MHAVTVHWGGSFNRAAGTAGPVLPAVSSAAAVTAAPPVGCIIRRISNPLADH
jgi:hypothetical protein